jgi:hypothetical protein
VRLLALALTMLTGSVALAQQPAWPSPLPISVGQPPEPPVPTGLPQRYEAEPPPEPPEAPGQQHWVAVTTSILQPMVGRVQVKVWPRPNNSIWVEAYGGSVLFDVMYGFGVRVMHTAKVGRRGDVMMVSPGLGVHILPMWLAERGSGYSGIYGVPYYYEDYNALYYVAGDIDISWLHDFGDHFGFELGIKVGLAGRVAGRVGRDYPRSVMFGPDVYPIFNIYSGFRF